MGPLPWQEFAQPVVIEIAASLARPSAWKTGFVTTVQGHLAIASRSVAVQAAFVSSPLHHEGNDARNQMVAGFACEHAAAALLPLCPLACFCGFDTIWADPAYGLSAASEQKWISVAADSEPTEAGYMIAKT